MFAKIHFSFSRDMGQIMRQCITQCWKILIKIPGSGSRRRRLPKFKQLLFLVHSCICSNIFSINRIFKKIENFMAICLKVANYEVKFLPRCMQCRCSLAMKILSVHQSVCLSNMWCVTKWKQDKSRFLYHTKDLLAQFSEKKNGNWLVESKPFYLKFWVNQPLLKRNRRISTDIRP